MRPLRRGPACAALLLALTGTDLAQAQPEAPPGEDAIGALLARSCPAPARAGGDSRPLYAEAVLQAVVCRSATVRRGAGLQLQADAAWREAQARRQPALSAVGGVTRGSGGPAQGSLGVQGSWVLSDFGAGAAQVRAADTGRRATQDERLDSLLQAMAEGTQLYADALSAQGRWEAAADALRSATANERMASARQQAGATSSAEALQAQRALGQARLDFTRALGTREQTLLALKSAIGLPPDQALRLAGEASLADARRWAEQHGSAALDAWLEHHPQLQAARRRQSEARHRTEAVQAERWGRLQLDASASRQQAEATAGARSSQSLGVAWTVPLWDGGVQRARTQAAEGQALVARHDADEATRRLALAAQQARAALEAERNALRTAEQLADTADAALRVTGERFRRGVGGYQEVLSAQDAAASARNQRADARAALLRARWLLAVALGDLSALSAGAGSSPGASGR